VGLPFGKPPEVISSNPVIPVGVFGNNDWDCILPFLTGFVMYYHLKKYFKMRLLAPNTDYNVKKIKIVLAPNILLLTLMVNK
jgi:hypothetical protein